MFTGIIEEIGKVKNIKKLYFLSNFLWTKRHIIKRKIEKFLMKSAAFKIYLRFCKAICVHKSKPCAIIMSICLNLYYFYWVA